MTIYSSSPTIANQLHNRQYLEVDTLSPTNQKIYTLFFRVDGDFQMHFFASEAIRAAYINSVLQGFQKIGGERDNV